ncbi:hypothetical protein RUM44_006448 [Polyplax serrata]|uniref:Endoplasmic reticulum junction formation protein lunapark n=1 Tax=Polyplax serrata TaxID=468196 RepID=A0ABR1AI76_POLSC
MGIVLSRFRKKKSAVEVLEKLQNDIKELEENKSYAQIKHRQIKKLLYIYSVGMCILCGIIFYFQYSSTFRQKLIYMVPLALSPILLLIVSRLISWYYGRLINKNQSLLIEMKKEKKRILDEVMDKETYKVAKEILDKYSTDNVPKEMELRKRAINTTTRPGSPIVKGPSPRLPIPSPNAKQFQQSGPIGRVVPPRPMPGPGPMMRLPAPVIPLERSYIDKMVEYLIGDGPNNRFALICSRCHSHNGMALKEEFEYTSFKCCYCFFYNPSRKVRPDAPKLEESVLSQSIIQEADSDSESKSAGENTGKYKAELQINGKSGDISICLIVLSCCLMDMKKSLNPFEDSDEEINKVDETGEDGENKSEESLEEPSPSAAETNPES